MFVSPDVSGTIFQAAMSILVRCGCLEGLLRDATETANNSELIQAMVTVLRKSVSVTEYRNAETRISASWSAPQSYKCVLII
jgi:hypothetical protein